VAKETIKLANLSIPEQHFGAFHRAVVGLGWTHRGGLDHAGLITESNVTFIDQVSGILGLGFPRLSSISRRTNSTPFFPTLAYKGLLEYPLFALSLAKNHTGSLSLGKFCPLSYPQGSNRSFGIIQVLSMLLLSTIPTRSRGIGLHRSRLSSTKLMRRVQTICNGLFHWLPSLCVAFRSIDPEEEY
jgi:hypothetical protein